MPSRRQLEHWNNRARASSVAALNWQEHIAQRDKEAQMAPKKPRVVGEVPVVNRLKGHPGEGEVLGTASVEKLSGGSLVIRIDGSMLTGEILLRGFSLGDLSINEDPIEEN